MEDNSFLIEIWWQELYNRYSPYSEGTGKAGFKTQELLDSHFEKHAAEFGNITKEQYLKGAQDLVSSKPGGNILTKTRSNGDILFYNKANNEFAVKASDETIRTYFKPTDGVDGNPVLTIETAACSIRYAGEYLDKETGLYYLRARYYDPYIGRFISEDSYWGEDDNPLSLNLYTYCQLRRGDDQLLR
jgi:RHS repeat-associated protein